jgi:FkbM family methyltransferase
MASPKTDTTPLMSFPEIRSRRSLPFRIKQLAMKTACHPWVGHVVAGWTCNQIRNRGCLIDTSHSSVSPSVKASLYWGAFEKSEVLFVKQHLPTQYDVIELGAGIGVVSSHISKRLEPDRRLLCVEANPDIVPWISRNVQQNSAIQPIVVHAAIDYSGQPTMEMRLADRHLDSSLESSGSTPNRREQVGGERSDRSERRVAVPVMTLTELWQQLGMSPFSLVADIEGAELGILEEESECLSACQGMVIELHATQRRDGTRVEVSELVDLIKKRHQLELVARRGEVFAFVR